MRYLQVSQLYQGQLKVMDAELEATIFDESLKPSYDQLIKVTDHAIPLFGHGVFRVLPDRQLELIAEAYDGSG